MTMTLKSLSGKQIAWFEDFQIALRTEIRNLNKEIHPKELGMFDKVLARTLLELVYAPLQFGPYGGRQAAFSCLADNSDEHRDLVRKRVRLAAQCSILTTVITRAENKGGKFNPIEVVLCKEFEDASRGLWGMQKCKLLLATFAERYMKRRIYDDVMQGFVRDVEWGRPEVDAKGASQTEARETPPLATTPTMIVRAIGLEVNGAKTNAEKKNDKNKDRFIQLAKEAEFITASANLWVKGQSKNGFGRTRPVWEGLPSDLPSDARQQRMDLVKLLRKFGGRQTAYAWMAFCSYTPKRDSKGNIAFDPNIGYRQWASSDKRPTQFAKYYNQLVNDPAVADWIANDKDAREGVESYYRQELLAMPPSADVAPEKKPSFNKEVVNGKPAAAVKTNLVSSIESASRAPDWFERQAGPSSS